MEWYRLVSHPYIIQMPEHDRPPVVAPMRGPHADRARHNMMTHNIGNQSLLLWLVIYTY